MSVVDALLEGFAPEPEADPFEAQPFALGDQVRVSVGGGASSVIGKVMRAHGGPPATHAVVAPDGGGAHVLAPIGQVKLNTPAQHAAAEKRAQRQEAKAEQDKATAAWMASKPPNVKVPASAGGSGSPRVREGVAVLLEGFETPAQSQVLGAQDAAKAKASLAAGYKTWNPGQHPRAQGGKFGYSTGGKRATRGQQSGSRTLAQGSNGALVKSIQRQLGVPADGQYGPQTQAAVSRFQQQHGLQVDGVVGAQTLAALRGGTNAVAPGPITSRQATVKAHPATRKPGKPAAPVRVGGGVIV